MTKQRMAIMFMKNIPANVKAQFKAYCARREISMTQAIVDYMKSVVTKAEKGTGLRP